MPTTNSKTILERELKEVDHLISAAEKRLKKNEDAPKGKLRITKSHGYTRFYFQKEGEDKKVYITSEDSHIVRRTVQYQYDSKVMLELQKIKKNLLHALQTCDADLISQIYQNMSNGRKEIVIPIEPTEEQFVAAWYAEHPGEQNTYPEKGIFQTNRGEMVRSKSEKIIADLLYRLGIPYVYEPKIVLKDGHVFYPDFAILRTKTRETIYLEHFGKTGDSEYAVKNFRKLDDYERNGFFIGKNLIITMEAEDRPLDIRLLEKKIRMYFL